MCFFVQFGNCFLLLLLFFVLDVALIVVALCDVVTMQQSVSFKQKKS